MKKTHSADQKIVKFELNLEIFFVKVDISR